jgi:Protein of unknown function (DUF2537)
MVGPDHRPRVRPRARWSSGDRMELGDRQPGDAPLPADLQSAVREWSALAVFAARSAGPGERALLRRRGLQLAGRVADVLGRPVEFTDPSTGEIESVRVGAPGPAPRLSVRPPGPTPWATGLTVSAFFAVFATVGDVALSRAFAEAFGLLWIPANLLVALGLAPSIYLLRRVPFWRWPAIGTAAGLAAAWVALLLGLLG